MFSLHCCNLPMLDKPLSKTDMLCTSQQIFVALRLSWPATEVCCNHYSTIAGADLFPGSSTFDISTARNTGAAMDAVFRQLPTVNQPHERDLLSERHGGLDARLRPQELMNAGSTCNIYLPSSCSKACCISCYLIALSCRCYTCRRYNHPTNRA